MKDRQVQHLVSQIIAAAQLVPEKYYHLCWWQEQVRCHHVRHTKNPHEVFYSALGHVFLDGPSIHQWRLITTRIAEFCAKQGFVLDLASGRRKEASARPMPRRRITEFDAARLQGLLTSARTPGFGPYAYLDRLQHLLKRADIVDPRAVSSDVVTMNSEVRLRNDEVDVERTVALVFPADARGSDLDKPKLSVFTDTGLSILGRRVGDAIGGNLKILELPYQPEAAGDFYL